MSEGATVAPRVPSRVLITGPEALLAERALAHVLEELRVESPDLEVERVYPEAYAPGDLHVHTSPSLFGGAKAVVVHDLDVASDDLIADVKALAAAPAEPDLTLIVAHKGGNRAKGALDAMRAAGARVFEAPAIKTDRDKVEFATHEFRSAHRKATGPAVQALVDAVGKDVRELAAAARQLIDDTTGVIDENLVLTYHGGKVEATGFRVADAALAGDTGEAMRLLRHALAVGVDPVPIVAVLAAQVRQLIRVASAGRGRSADLARDLGMAPWQVEKAQRALRGWSAAALADCVHELARTDEEVKGGGRDPVFSVERAVLTIAAAHGR